MTNRVTRRAMLGVLPGTLLLAVPPSTRKAKAPVPQVGEFTRFLDPTTESIVVRLTDPRSNSQFPGANSRFVLSKDHFLIFSSDRTGRFCPYRLDLRTGQLAQLAATESLHPDLLSVDQQGRTLYFLDGPRLMDLNLSSRRTHELSDKVDVFSVGSGSPPATAILSRGELTLLGSNNVLAEDAGSPCSVRPGSNGCFFTREISPDERQFWYVPFPSGKPIRLVSGKVSNPVWAPDGRSLMFLRNVGAGQSPLTEIHEANPETGLEQRLDPTSQFASFSPNADASVFVGASSSRAQPTVILLLRALQRELTLCEHRATHPAGVSPVFSPDSRRVYFQSDYGGKSALYSVNVEQLVEPT